MERGRRKELESVDRTRDDDNLLEERTVQCCCCCRRQFPLRYTPGGGSGGGLGSRSTRGGRSAKADREATWCATSTGRCQRSSTARPVGAAGHRKMWGSELHSGQRSESEVSMACL